MYSEAIVFVRTSLGKSMDILLESAAKLDDPLAALEFTDKLHDAGDKSLHERLGVVQRAILTVLESRGHTFPYIAKLDDPVSIAGAQTVCEEYKGRISKYLPNVSIQRTDLPRNKIIRFEVIAESSNVLSDMEIDQLRAEGHGTKVWACGHKSSCRCRHGGDSRLRVEMTDPCYDCKLEEKLGHLESIRATPVAKAVFNWLEKHQPVDTDVFITPDCERVEISIGDTETNRHDALTKDLQTQLGTGVKVTSSDEGGKPEGFEYLIPRLGERYGLMEGVDESNVNIIKQLYQVGSQHHKHAMPGYGEVWWHNDSHTACWVSGDADEPGTVNAAKDALKAINGVVEVVGESEVRPKTDTWKRIYPPENHLVS